MARLCIPSLDDVDANPIATSFEPFTVELYKATEEFASSFDDELMNNAPFALVCAVSLSFSFASVSALVYASTEPWFARLENAVRNFCFVS